MRKCALVAVLISTFGAMPAQPPTTSQLKSLIGPSEAELLAARLGQLNQDILALDGIQHVTQASEGADLDFLIGCRGSVVERESH